jgi:hypothetical protein
VDRARSRRDRGSRVRDRCRVGVAGTIAVAFVLAGVGYVHAIRTFDSYYLE